MDEKQFATLKSKVTKQLSDLRQKCDETLAIIESALHPLLVTQNAVQDALHRMDRASAKLPLGYFAYCYAKGMQRARGPVMHFDGSISKEYEEISEAEVEQLKADCVTPATDAFSRVYPQAQRVLQDVQNYALSLRFFSNSEPLLSQYALILAPPWYESVNVEDLKPVGQWRVHYAYASLPYRLPPHVEMIAQRRASVDSLYLLQSKFRALQSLLEVSLTELDFATPRSEPAAVPSTWYDYSVTIGDNANVDRSAVGSQATVETRVI